VALFLEQLLNGLTVGSVYAVVALGYTMVYGVLRLINFAHGELFMLGAYVGFTLLVADGRGGRPALGPCSPPSAAGRDGGGSPPGIGH